MCSITQLVAASAEELPTASAARLLPFSEKPMDTSCREGGKVGRAADGETRVTTLVQRF